MIVGVATLLLPLTAMGVRQAVRSNANDVRDWLPAHYSETEQFRWFNRHFGSEDFVVVSWEGSTLDDPRLDQFAAELRKIDSQRAAKGLPSLFRRITTGRELLAQLSSEPLLLSRREIAARLRGTLVGPDGEQTCAVLTLSDEARLRLHETLAVINSVARQIGLAASDVHLGGPPVVNAAIDRSSTQSLVRLAGLAGLVGLVVAWWCFRTLRLTFIVFVIATYSAALSLAVVPLFGIPMNAILVTMVPLVYVAAMSGAIHLSNYYLDNLRAGRAHGAIGHAVRHAALPLSLAAGTTAVGLLSLLYSDLLPIRLFGVFSAIGVGIALVMQFVLLPSLLTLWPAGKGAASEIQRPEEEEAGPLSPWGERLARVVIRRHAFFSLACLALLGGGAWGLTRMETSIEIMRLFAPDTPILSSYDWLERRLGAMVPMEIVLRFDEDNQQSLLSRLLLVKRVQEAVGELPQVGGSLSAATFAPQIDTSRGGSLRNFVISRRLLQARPRFIESGYLVEGDDGAELWRVSVRVDAISDIDYGVFQNDLRAKVDPLLAEAEAQAAASQGADSPGEASPAGGTISAVYTGAVPIIYKARRSLLDGLILGFGTDVTLIVLAMIIAMRHWSSGLLLLLTCVFPMTLVFGLMGWLGIVVDIGSVMTPCVALGVTVDDVIHFVLWFRRGIERGLSIANSVLLAYQGCGRAMVQSWGVIGLGLSAFALSSFIPTFRFGALMIALLTVGLAGNLLFLPALLAGPIGRQIQRSVMKRKAAAAPTAGETPAEPTASQP